MKITGYHISPDLIIASDGGICREPPWLDFLLDGEGIKVLYHIDYSVANLLRMLNLSDADLVRLHDKGRIRIGGYNLRYVPKKFFSIAYGREFTILSDMSQYMDNWNLEGDAPEKAREARAIGEEVYNALTKLGLHPKSLVSPISAFAKEILEKMDLPLVEDMPEGAAMYAYSCAHGPWVEAFQKGHYTETEDWDIRSAYGAQLAELADFRYGRWRKSRWYEPEAYYGYAKGIVNITADFSPIIYSKTEDQNFTPKGEWEMYLTKAEIDFIEKYGIGTFELHSGWWWFCRSSPSSPEKIVKPLEGLMQWLYAKKEQSNGLEKMVLKRIMAGCWGKFLEIRQDEELGDFFNPCWGVEVESRTRLEVARFVLDNGLTDRLLSIAVDGVLVLKN